MFAIISHLRNFDFITCPAEAWELGKPEFQSKACSFNNWYRTPPVSSPSTSQQASVRVQSETGHSVTPERSFKKNPATVRNSE